MRGLPFFKGKKGPQFAGMNFSNDTSGGSYTLPTATASRLGGVKIGTGISVEEDGTISASSGGGVGYSTTEVNTGLKWTDGKDIYKRTFMNVSGNSYIQTEIMVDTFIADELNGNGVGGVQVTQNNHDYGLSTYYAESAHMFYVNAGSGVSNINVTLYYTKS